MKPRICRPFFLALLLAASSATAQTLVLPLQLSQQSTPWNFVSLRGVPISTVSNVPPGSDGRLPTTVEGDPQNPPATSNQFRGFLAFGGVTGLNSNDWSGLNSYADLVAGTNPFSGVVAAEMKRPVGRAVAGDNSSAVVWAIRQAQFGQPMVSQQVSYSFGSEISPPVTDELGRLLTNVLNTTYWLPQPFFTTNQTDVSQGFYWSPNAKKVFAIQSGPIKVTWIKAAGYSLASKPAYTNLSGSFNFVTNGGTVYALYTVSSVVSGSAVKTPQKMYWTEKPFNNSGQLVSVPPGSVSALNFVYNQNFPETVSQAYVDPYTPPPTDPTNLLQEVRTLWYDNNTIHAFNVEGRVFLELLGEPNPDGSRRFLGFEIVDVFKEPFPTDITVDLGERVPAFADGHDDSGLYPSPLLNTQQKFYYRQTLPNTDLTTLYATYATVNLNDFQAYWLIPGVAGLRWPYLFNRYQEVWPTDIWKYSNYIRTQVATEAEAAATAVQLPANESPQMPYQDPLPAPFGAKLDVSGVFYTYLNQTYPAHRALLQFRSGNNVSFERVFSWLDANIKAGDFSNPIASSLASVTNYLGYPDRVAAYQAALTAYNSSVNNYNLYLSHRNRSVNGSWNLSIVGGSLTGSLSSWSIVVAYNDDAGVSQTKTFTFGSVSIASGGSGSSSGQVLGITNQVTSVRLVLTGVTLTGAPAIVSLNSPIGGHIDAFIFNPANVANRNYTFDDFEFAPPTQNALNGFYLPTTGTMDSLLSAAVAAVPAPGSAPTPPETVFSPFPTDFVAPRVVNASVNVGDRISAPSGELGDTDSYLAGYILQTNGNSFNPRAYLNPFTVGFAQANQGAIIPVNAIPGSNTLEVWWFRQDEADQSLGFQPVYWPSVIGHYTLKWPAGGDEIILANNAGSGGLDSLQARGIIYRQNDRSQPGYNPNEEHAVMLAGQAYALSDDLNVTNAGAGYSSDPYVLLDYTGSDSRPAMRAFHVRREKPEAGVLFDYVTEAGSVLQGPMPLTLVAKPVEGAGQYAVNYNTEPPIDSRDLPAGWNNSFTNSVFEHYARYTYQDRKHDFWVYRGQHAGLPALQAGQYNATSNTFSSLPAATALVNQPFAYYVHASRRTESLTFSALNLPTGLITARTNGLEIAGTPTQTGSYSVTVIINDLADNSSVTNSFSLVVNNSGSVVAQAPLAITSTNQYSGALVTYYDRPPFLAQAPTPTNSFTMRFYYVNQPSFDWPGVASPPTNGAIVPYLLPRNSAGQLVGDPTSRTTASLDIVYRPVWPSLINGRPLPTLFSGETLTDPKRNLATVRGQSSVQVLYQQSIGLNITNAPPAVILHDPTVEKISSLEEHSLSGLPSGVIAKPYLGKYYFPNLPPNLVNRVFYDANLEALVLEGQFNCGGNCSGGTGDSYLLLNVLRGPDLDAVLALCPDSDAKKSMWDDMVNNLAVSVLTFHEDPAIPGSYVANPDATVTRSVDDLVEITNADSKVDSYALSATGPGVGYVSYLVGNGHDPAHASEPVSLYILRVDPELYQGEIKVIADPNPLSENISFQHTADLAGRSSEYQYDWRIAPPVDGRAPTTDPTNWTPLVLGPSLDHYTLYGSAGIQSLSDNYVSLRYRSLNPLARPDSTNWSQWTGYLPGQYTLAEGWIKRALNGITPFTQRTTDLFNNPVNTTASIISQAGHRWEGDIALNQDSLNQYGLIEIYETILNRGKAISINASGGGINYGPANDALLLAAGYLNDLYMFIGNDAWADAANPTIGIGTADHTYGNIATALFAFKGQEATLLDEEQALLRGRDDTESPGSTIAPVYNRLFWNYTRGIDAGEVIYALNYNILDQNLDGVVDATDASILFPQGHGDAYGHYLTALTSYYSLFMNPNFDWVPRAEAVTVLGATVSVDYQDERKFAAAAAAAARTGRQIFDLEWRHDYTNGPGAGWAYFGTAHTNAQTHLARYWGMDHWATRITQGSYINWLVGNTILPPVDPDPEHQGIQKVDRTTVPELLELTSVADAVQSDLDNAEAGLTPLGLSQNAIPFDINPLQVTGVDPKTHFEQIYDRAVAALNNAVVSFDDAQNVTELMRSEEDSLANLQAANTNQELAYNSQLIEIFGTPYPDDIGPGKTYLQGYQGPDIIHYTYVENPDTNNFNGVVPDPTVNNTFNVDVQNVPADWLTAMGTEIDIVPTTDPQWVTDNKLSISFNIGPNGFFDKPATWKSERLSPGTIQQKISKLIAAQNRLRKVVVSETYDKIALDKSYLAFRSQMEFETNVTGLANGDADLQMKINDIQQAYDVSSKAVDYLVDAFGDAVDAIDNYIPELLIAGLSFGGDQLKSVKEPLVTPIYAAKYAAEAADMAGFTSSSSATTALENQILADSQAIANAQLDEDTKDGILALGNAILNLRGDIFTINEAMRDLSDAEEDYHAEVAKGNRILQERTTFRQHAAALVQGFRTRDAAFRIFQNEKLERYKTLFDLAAQYAFLAAQAYDYETGLLNTDQGKSFLNRIISARALGVVQNGQPQYAGSSTGDPGLSSALAEMKADWDVLKGRLGFNNPDGYGTTVSLRKENYRILSGSAGDNNWMDVLQRSQMPDILADPDVKRSCLQLDNGSGQPVPGIVLTFSTEIADGFNLFGQQLAPGDHNFSPSSFATKIFATGVDFDGYIGMDNPTPGNTAGGSSPPDPSLDPNALAATPYVYLIAAGTDSMRSPPLGDANTIRSWNVDDVTIPLPFNIGGSGFSSQSYYTAADSLTEPLFSVRKSPAFRPVSSTTAFNTSIYGANGSLQPSQYTNGRLIGRSIWNSRWKLVIPGKTLLADPTQGLSRFIHSVKDIKLYFVTYSYAGN